MHRMITHIAVLGAGTMGLGIARLFAEYGYPVRLFEPSAQVRERVGRVPAATEKAGAAAGKTANPDVTDDLMKAVAGADLIVEAAPEQPDVKRELYGKMAPAVKDTAIVASNTSTMPLRMLASGQPFAERMVIAHFFNPPQLVPLVELVSLPETAPGIVESLAELLRRCHKTPVVLRKDVPGFIANRLQAALLREACWLLRNGVADAGQIDAAVKEGIGLRYAFKGPFEIADFGGLDIWEKVAERLFPELDNSGSAPELLPAKVRNGELGLKSGKGFYEYDHPAAASERWKRELADLVSLKINMDRRNRDDDR